MQVPEEEQVQTVQGWEEHGEEEQVLQVVEGEAQLREGGLAQAVVLVGVGELHDLEAACWEVLGVVVQKVQKGHSFLV